VQRRIEIAHAQHGVQKSHGDLMFAPTTPGRSGRLEDYIV